MGWSSLFSQSQALPIRTVKVSLAGLFWISARVIVKTARVPRPPVYSECLPQTAVYLFSNPLPTQKRFLTRGISAVASERVVVREFFIGKIMIKQVSMDKNDKMSRYKCSFNLFVNLLVCKLRPILITKTEKKQSHGSEQNIISPTPSDLKVHSVY